MAEADWTNIASSLGAGDILEGVSTAFTLAHASAGIYCYALHAVSATTGFGGKSCHIANFNPTLALKGGSISAAFKKYSSNAGYAPMIGVIDNLDVSSAKGYFLGLTSGTSYHVGLKKGTMASQLLASGSNILSLSDDAFTAVGDSQTGWFHLRLDVLINPHGEIVIDVYENDYYNNGVVAPIWTAISGMDQFIDDPTGVLTGEAPYTSGLYFVFGMYCENAAGAVSLFDQIRIFRQTSP